MADIIYEEQQCFSSLKVANIKDHMFKTINFLIKSQYYLSIIGSRVIL